MPKSLPRSFTDEFLRSNGIFDLDPKTLLQPDEAAVLLGTTTMSLERARKAGDPPPFRRAKPGAVVRYVLNDVLAARKLHRHASIAAVARAHDDSLVSYLTFNRFLATAIVENEWPFVSTGLAHRPVDFFFALTLPIAGRKDVRWLTLLGYLEALRVALNAEPYAELSDARQSAMNKDGAGLSSKDCLRS